MNLTPPDFKLFGMTEAELKRTLFPKSLQWRINRLIETLVDLAFWYKPKPPKE